MSSNAIRRAVIKWQKNNKEYCNDRSRMYIKNLKLKVLNIIGTKCVCCGVSEWWNLTIDHIKPIEGKRQHHTKLYKSIIDGDENIEDYQTMCHGCNTSKSKGDKCKLEHNI